MVSTYFIPLTCLAITYSLVGRKLWSSSTIGEPTPRQLEVVEAKKKVTSLDDVMLPHVLMTCDDVCELIAGGTDVGCCCRHLRSVLAPHSHLLSRGNSSFTSQHQALHSTRVPRHLLGCHEQLHVQPNHLLLDEQNVRQFTSIFFLNNIFSDVTISSE